MSTRNLAAVILTSLALVATPGAAVAAPGQPDPGFGAGGVVSRDGSPVASVAHQADGKVVVAGGHSVTRFDPDGSLDTSFGSGGSATATFGGSAPSFADVAVQDDGRIVAVGSSDRSGDKAVVLARFLQNGALDTSFDGDGKVISDLSREYDDEALDVVTSGTKIVVSGHINLRNEPGQHADWLTDDDLLVARYAGSGKLDRTFARKGWTTVDLGDWDRAAGLAVTRAGKVLVIGRGIDGLLEHPYLDYADALVRLNRNGSRDHTFGTRGAVDISYRGWSVRAEDIVLQPDGRIVLSGQVMYEPSGWEVDSVVRRYTASGTPDTTFGGDGVATVDFIGPNELLPDHAPSVAVAAGGKVFVLDGAATDAVRIARLRVDGAPDLSFGQAGIAELPVEWRDGAEFEDWRTVGRTMSLDRGGRVVVGGDAKSGLVLARLMTR